MLRKKTVYKKIQDKPTASIKEIKKFRDAIFAGNVEAVRKFTAKYGKDKDSMNAAEGYQSVLYHACKNGLLADQEEKYKRFLEIVEILLSSPVIAVNGEHASKPCEPPLHIAASHNVQGRSGILKLLLNDPRVDKNIVYLGKTPLHTAVEKQKTANVAALIACEAVDVNAKVEVSQRTALHLAAENRDLPVTNILLNRKEIDINARSKDGNTPAHIAALHGQGLIARNLIQRPEFATNAQNNKGETLLAIAVNKKSKKTLPLLLGKADIDINLASTDGDTPLIKALKNHDKDRATALLARPEINVRARDHRGLEALHWAANSGNLDALTALLLRPDIDVNTQSDGGCTPLDVAVDCGNIEAVKLLLSQKNIDANIVSKEYGSTALTFAAKHNNAVIIRLLLDHGADAGHINNAGFTARMIAADAGHFGIAELLTDAEKSQKSAANSPLQKHSLLARHKTSAQANTKPENIPASPKL